MKDKLIVIIIIVLIFAGGVFYYISKMPLSSTTPAQNTSTKKSVQTVGYIVGSRRSDTLGEYLTDARGNTLYIFADDGKLQSNCKRDCVKTWPSFSYNGKNLASSTDTLSHRMNVFKKSDGTWQYAYGEKPVYYYVGDKAPGDTNGNNIGGKWSIIVLSK